MAGRPLVALVAVFAGSAAAIRVAGVQLSRQTDVLSTRLHLGAALGGLIPLALATNLPEIAIVASAAVSGSVGVAVGNILGGIAIQLVVLVVLVVLGALDVLGTQLPAVLVAARLTPAPVLIAGLWVTGLLLRRAGTALPWHESGEAPDNQKAPLGHSSRRWSTTPRGRGSAPGAPRASSRSPRW